MTLQERLDFIDQVVPYAVQSLHDYGIPASATIAQAALESNWGRKALGNNFFGIKITPARAAEIQKLIDTGTCTPETVPDDVQVFWTREETPAGESYRIKDIFRRYPTAADCFAHRERILMGKRYKPAMAAAADPREFCRQLQACGWATAHDYASILISIIAKYGLEKYDKP